MASSEIAILIPAYNEENTIQKVINDVAFYGKVIVVDDFSRLSNLILGSIRTLRGVVETTTLTAATDVQ